MPALARPPWQLDCRQGRLLLHSTAQPYLYAVISACSSKREVHTSCTLPSQTSPPSRSPRAQGADDDAVVDVRVLAGGGQAQVVLAA